MRDAGGQAADRLHFLRLTQLGFETIALGEVARDRRDADHLAVADEDARVHVHRCRTPLARHEFGAKGPRRAVGALVDHLLDRIEVIGPEDPGRIEHAQLVAQVAGELLAAAVDGRDAAATIVHDHDLARAFEQIVEPRLQRGFARNLAADGYFLRAAAPVEHGRHAHGDDADCGHEQDPPGCVCQFSK